MEQQVILLVEDNPDDEALTVRALRKNNILNEIVVARDGVEALDYLFGTGIYAGRDTARQPQVILLDLKMPKLDGLEVLKRLKAADNRTPVIVLTAYQSVELAQEAVKLGAMNYLPKPFERQTVLGAVASVLQSQQTSR